MLTPDQTHHPPQGYAITKLSPAIIICPITRFANILTAKLIGLMRILMSSTGTSNTHIKGCTPLGVILTNSKNNPLLI